SRPIARLRAASRDPAASHAVGDPTHVASAIGAIACRSHPTARGTIVALDRVDPGTGNPPHFLRSSPHPDLPHRTVNALLRAGRPNRPRPGAGADLPGRPSRARTRAAPRAACASVDTPGGWPVNSA